MITEKTPARIRREAARHDVARELLKARAQSGHDQHELAAACGVNRSVPQDWESREGVKSPWVADLALLPAAVALPLIRWAAERHGHTIVAADPHGAVIDATTMHETLKESAEATVALAAALADGHLTTQELEQIERESQEAAEAFQRLALRARAQREGARPLRICDHGK